MTAFLALDGVTVHYGGVRALESVDLSVGAGEVLVLLGDTGAGKSTLMKVMAGALRPDGGSVSVDGQPVTLRSPREAAGHNIQMVYQDLALLGGHDVVANLALGREPVKRGLLGRLGFLDRSAMRAQARAELALLGAELPLDRRVEALSGGQRQLVALARSAVRVARDRGGALLLDEPTAALGAAQMGHLEALVKRIAEQGSAVVLCTHNLPFGFAVGDRIAVLNRGRKVADVPADRTDTAAVVRWITGAD